MYQDPYVEARRMVEKYASLDLSTGLPDMSDAWQLIEYSSDQFVGLSNRYSEHMGLPDLRSAISRSPLTGANRDPMEEITIVTGATEGIYASIAALTRPGDQVISFHPYYDYYEGICKILGLDFITAGMRFSEGIFSSNPDDILSLVSKSTRIILLNYPHNPTGVCIDRDEWDTVLQVAQRKGLIIIVDCVYEAFRGCAEVIDEGRRRYPAVQVVTISSASKTLGVAGWRVGWVVAAPGLTRRIRHVHRNITACAPTPLQAAVARLLTSDSFSAVIDQCLRGFERSKARLTCELLKNGYEVNEPTGGLFLMARRRGTISSLLAEKISQSLGITPLVIKSYYPSDSEEGESWVRINFSKALFSVNAAMACSKSDPDDSEKVCDHRSGFSTSTLTRSDEHDG